MPSFVKGHLETLLARLAAARGIPSVPGRQPVSHWLTSSDGIQLHYRDWPGGGSTFVMLHGGHLSSHTFDLLIMALGPSCRCIALDLRGHGDSGWSSNYSVDRMACDVVEVIKSLDLISLHLVGMSLGGCVAGHAANRLGEQLASLALLDIGPCGNPAIAVRIGKFLNDVLPASSVQEVVERALHVAPHTDPDLMLYRYHSLLRRDSSGVSWKADTRQAPDYAHILASMAELWDVAPSISCPVLIVKGGRSHVLATADVEAFAQRFQDGSWVIAPEAGHNIQEDAPAELAAILRTSFMRSRASFAPRSRSNHNPP